MEQEVYVVSELSKPLLGQPAINTGTYIRTCTYIHVPGGLRIQNKTKLMLIRTPSIEL